MSVDHPLAPEGRRHRVLVRELRLRAPRHTTYEPLHISSLPPAQRHFTPILTWTLKYNVSPPTPPYTDDDSQPRSPPSPYETAFKNTFSNTGTLRVLIVGAGIGTFFNFPCYIVALAEVFSLKGGYRRQLPVLAKGSRSPSSSAVPACRHMEIASPSVAMRPSCSSGGVLVKICSRRAVGEAGGCNILTTACA